jgi:predicted DNA-binding transcriptional regulator AlpA
MQQTYYRMRELATTKDRQGRVPFSPATVWRLVREQKFPSPVKLSERVTAWPRASIEAWEAERLSGARRG